MWLVWSVCGGSAGLVAAGVTGLRKELRAAPRSWQLLACSGIPLTLGGLGFVLRFWEPTPGPYQANALYPLGPYLNAWAVSFGFMWLAFGLVFYALALLAPRTRATWILLLVSWFLAWLPHGIIGLGFAFAGSNQPSLDLYRSYASRWTGLLQLCASTLLLLAHVGLSLVGFALTGKGLRRADARGVSA